MNPPVVLMREIDVALYSLVWEKYGSWGAGVSVVDNQAYHRWVDKSVACGVWNYWKRNR